jgi:hypothetical protein
MTKITLNFKNLCALFTKKLNDELMVGLLDLTDFYGVPKEDIHYPKITIETEKTTTNPNGETVSIPQVYTYTGFSENNGNCSHDSEAHASDQPSECMGHLFGKISLEVHGHEVEPGLSQELSASKIAELKNQETDRRRKTKEIEEGQEVEIRSFDSILDFQKRLHVNEELTVMPGLCKARFHFQHGLLYAISLPPFAPVEFEPANPGADDEYPVETGLEIELTEDKYAVLRFINSDTQDFVFPGAEDQHYFVTIENSPPEHQHNGPPPNHFKYYYKLVAPPHETYLPVDPSPGAGDPFCWNGGFGDTNY